MITQESTDPVKESPTRVNDVTREMAEKNTTPDITIEPNTDSVLTPKKQSISALFITTPTHQNAQIKSARNIETPSTDLPIRIRRAIRKRSGSLPSPTSILLPNTGLLFSKTPSASRPPSRPSSRATTPTHVPDHTPISRKRIKKLPSTFIKYLQSELSVEYATDAEETIPESPKQAIDEQVRKNVYNLLHVPLELEKFLFYGVCVCLDAFLYYFTFLPLRILITIYSFLFRSTRIKNAHALDIVKSLSLVLNVILIHMYWDYSQVYHIVRGESALKLYVIYNMLEVFDRLCSAFGQDIQNSLFFTATDPKFWIIRERWRKEPRRSSIKKIIPLVFHLIFGFTIHSIYLYIHTLVQLFRVITLNVALNSSNNALFTLLVSNNFVELKGNVFKKVSDDNMFSISCGDALERFGIIVYGILIYMQNARSAVFGGAELLSVTMMFVAEIAVDGIKHAFIAKYNEMKADIYSKFRLKLCEDLTNNRENSFLDNTSTVSARMGFMEIPIVSLSIRVFLQSVPHMLPPTSSLNIIVYLLGYCCLFALKVLLSVIVVGYASRKIVTKTR